MFAIVMMLVVGEDREVHDSDDSGGYDGVVMVMVMAVMLMMSSAEHHTHGSEHAKQVLYHRAPSPASSLICKYFPISVVFPLSGVTTTFVP
jgi:hypothetical protein